MMVECKRHDQELFKVLFAAGGTGGHLFPALAVAQELKTRAPQSKVLFVGTRKGVEAALVPDAGFETTFISIYGMKRRVSMSNVLLPFFGLKCLFQSFLLLKRFSPHIVFGTGGYVSGPVLLAAVLCGIPTMLHEQNSRPGLTVRWLARWVSMVLLSVPLSEVYLKRKDNLRLTGNPTRFGPRDGDHQAALMVFGLSGDLDTILVFGGSQGAHSLNLAVLEGLGELMAGGTLQMLWQTGRADYEEIKDRAAPYGSRIAVLPFIETMADAYLVADVALCRAGATTIAEITRFGLPAIFVPYPHAAARHQELNARILVEAGAASMILDRELSGPKVAAAIMDLLGDTDKRKRMAERSRVLSRPRAAADIVEAIFELLGCGKRDHGRQE